jgi:hypothetical protein
MFLVASKQRASAAHVPPVRNPRFVCAKRLAQRKTLARKCLARARHEKRSVSKREHRNANQLAERATRREFAMAWARAGGGH